MTDIFEALRADHDKQRTLADLLAKTHGDSDGRRELFEKLALELRAHAAAEERIFYAELLGHERTREKARHSVSEHKDMEELLAELAETEYSSPGWLQRFKKLKHDVEHHLDEEEHEVFQQAGKVLGEREKTELAKRFQGAKDEQAAKL